MKNNQENQVTAPTVTEAEVKSTSSSFTREVWNLFHGGRLSVSVCLANVSSAEHSAYKKCVDVAMAQMVVQLNLG